MGNLCAMTNDSGRGLVASHRASLLWNLKAYTTQTNEKELKIITQFLMLQPEKKRYNVEENLTGQEPSATFGPARMVRMRKTTKNDNNNNNCAQQLVESIEIAH